MIAHQTQNTHALIAKRELARGAYILQFERKDINFSAGEHILLGIQGDIEKREYSIYSGIHDPYLEVLVKRVEGGAVSQRLYHADSNTPLTVAGPFGYFTINHATTTNRKQIYIATGSGIAPYHCFIKSHPQLNYQIIHGTRYRDEIYEISAYAKERYIHCVTREQSADFYGRVTEYLRQTKIDLNAQYYLCGNCDMIYEVFDILQNAHIPVEQISAEVYF